jgi:endonuclease IV
MAAIRFGPHSVPSQEDPRAAIESFGERGYGACEVDFEGGASWRARPGSPSPSTRRSPASSATSTRARSTAWRWGCSDHSAGVAVACGAEIVVFHYGEGTLRAEPLAEALARFERPATVIGESPDEASNQAIRAALLGEPARA